MPKCQQETCTDSFSSNVYSFYNCTTAPSAAQDENTFYHFPGQERVRVYDIFPPPLQQNTCSGWMCLNLQETCMLSCYI